MLMGAIHRILVEVVEGRLLYGRRIGTIEVLADFDENGNEVLLLHRYPSGLYPGVWAGSSPVLLRDEVDVEMAFASLVPAKRIAHRVPYREGCKYTSDLRESWIIWALYKYPMDPAALDDFDEFRGGAGQEYARRPWIRRVNSRVLVMQSCGRDI